MLGMAIISETKIGNKNRNEGDESDYFLKGFLVGYRRKKDIIHRLRVKQEENVREFVVRKEEKEWRSEVREMIEKEVTHKLDDMKQTIESLNEDRRKLKIEMEELKMKL